MEKYSYKIEEGAKPQFSNNSNFWVVDNVGVVFGGFETRKEAEKYLKELTTGV